jgi:hypothetical protein
MTRRLRLRDRHRCGRRRKRIAALGLQRLMPCACAMLWLSRVDAPAPDRRPWRASGRRRIAHAAAAIRHKLPGRILYRLAPASLVERLRQYLR